MAENQPVSMADSIRIARERLEVELRVHADHIQKLSQSLAELQQQHERTTQQAALQWDEMARAAEISEAAAAAKVSPETVLENVLGAVRGLMTCTMPEQVFSVLTEEAAQWGVRCAVFDVRGKAAWGASAQGFGPTLSDKVLRSLIVPLSQDNPFRQVCETAAHVDANADALKKNRNVLDKFKPAPHALILLLPIRSAGTVAAIFYADSGDKTDALPVNALKILAEFAGAQIDRLIALSGGFSSEETMEEAEEPAEAAAEEVPVSVAAEIPVQEPPVAEESPAAEEPAAVAAAPEPGVEEPAAPGVEEAPPMETAPLPEMPEDTVPAVFETPAAAPSSVEAEAAVAAMEAVQPAARIAPPPGEMIFESPEVSAQVPAAEEPNAEPVPAPVEATEPPAPPMGVEAATPVEPAIASAPVESEVPAPVPLEAAAMAVEAAPLSGEPPEPAVVEPPASATPEPAAAVFDVSQLSEFDQKLHKDAQRFARLLVSEIELYNKSKVADGRKNHDLYKRLKSDIDRSRQTFEKRFGKTLDKRFDYFHEEMVKTLAANDSSLLGPEYPGPTA